MKFKLIAGRNELATVSLWFYLPALMILAATVVGSQLQQTPIDKFTRDPAAVMGSDPLYGFVSNVGVLLWCAAAAMCFLTFAVLRAAGAAKDLQYMIVLGGLLSLILLCDDFFMFHDQIFPRRLGEKPIFLSYAILLAGWLWAFRRRIVDTSLLYLGLACFGFAVSLIVDRMPDGMLFWHYLYEDGSKFLGIASWCAYFFVVCRQSLSEAIAGK